MAKNKSTLGKLIAFATTAAAIGGACYIFRDQIKESEAYQKTKDKLDELRDKVNEKFAKEDDEDFYFDDEFEDDFSDDVFSEDAKNNREYTSITINPKESDAEDTVATDDEAVSEGTEDVTSEDANTQKDDMKEIFADTSIPTISFGSSTESKTPASEDSQYENQGLSDVDEDPDVLEEQDKLDF